MGRAVNEPLPQMRAALLPANAEWVREGSRSDRYMMLTLRGARGAWNPEYLGSLSPRDRGSIESSAGYRSLASPSVPEFESGLVPFFYVREAAAAAARKAGAQLGGAQRNRPGFDIFAAASKASEYARRLASCVSSGLALPGTPRLPEAFTELIAGRLGSAYLLSYLHHAYATPRVAYAAEEMDSWPVVPQWELMLVSRHHEGAWALRNSPFVSHLMALDPLTAAGRENGMWALVKSFLWDARPALLHNLASQGAAYVQDVSALWEICRILATAVVIPGIGDLPTSQAAVASEMQGLINATRGTPPPPPPPGTVTTHQPDRAPQPQAYPYGVSPRGAEQLCSDWMKFIGIPDARVTQFTADGGIDITSSDYVAQVKHYAGSVGAPEVQQLVGAAYSLGKKPLFFTAGRYTPAAQAAAARVDVPLFTYSAESGTLSTANTAAEALLRQLR